MGKHKPRTFITLCGHRYAKAWMIEYLKTHTAYEAKKEFPDVGHVSTIYKLARRLGVKMQIPDRDKYGPSATLCWKCGNSTNGNICPWVRNYTPVKGWEAKPHKIHFNNVTVDSYHVKKCPLFKEGRTE